MEKWNIINNHVNKYKIVKDCWCNNVYNLYLGYMIQSSFWKFRSKKFLKNRVKISEEVIFAFFATRKYVQFSAWSFHMRNFTSFREEKKQKKIINFAKVWPNFGSGRAVPGRIASHRRAAPGRELNRIRYTLKWNFLHSFSRN